MISLTVVGRIGKDAETRKIGNDTVTTFSVASSEKQKDGTYETTWVDCSIFGKRGVALEQYLRKGTAVTAIGSFKRRESNGKIYFGIKVDHIEIQDRKQQTKQDSTNLPQDESEQNSGGGSGDDDIPF